MLAGKNKRKPHKGRQDNATGNHVIVKSKKKKERQKRKRKKNTKNMHVKLMNESSYKKLTSVRKYRVMRIKIKLVNTS